MKKLLFFGAGALGCGIGYMLRDHETWFVGRKLMVDKINSEKMHVTGVDTGTLQVNAVTDIDDLNFKPDIVFITTKAYDTEMAIKNISEKWSDLIIVSIQNGLNNYDTINKTLKTNWKGSPEKYIVMGITNHGFYIDQHGDLVHAGNGSMWIGSYQKTDSSGIVYDLFTSSRINCILTDNIESIIWQKGIVNSIINPLTAILNVENGYLYNNQNLALVIDELLKEGVGIANTLNINISLDEVRNMLFDTIKKSSTNRSSMLRDIEMGRRTEIEEINGYIIKKGNFVKLKVIYNSLLYSLIRSMEELANKKRD